MNINWTSGDTEREVIEKLREAQRTLRIIVEEEEKDGEASTHLRRAIDTLQEALLQIQLSR